MNENLKKRIKLKFPILLTEKLTEPVYDIDILAFEDASELKNKISKDLKSVPLPSQDCEYDDYFFLIFLTNISLLSIKKANLLSEKPKLLI